MVREARKHSESVRRGSAIGHKCWNMRPEPGVAHQRLTWKCLKGVALGPKMFVSHVALLRTAVRTRGFGFLAVQMDGGLSSEMLRLSSVSL